MAMETTFLTSVLPNQNVLSTSESPTDSLSSNLLIEDLHSNVSQIMDGLKNRIADMMNQVNNILDEGLNGETDFKIDQVIDGVDHLANDTVEQVNTVVDSHFQINPEGVVDPLTGEMIIPSIHQPPFEMIPSDPIAIDTSLIIGELTMGTSDPELDETVTIPIEIGINEPLFDGSGNPLLTGIGTNEPLLGATVSDSSLL